MIGEVACIIVRLPVLRKAATLAPAFQIGNYFNAMAAQPVSGEKTDFAIT
jgi:hypothetical protein